MALTRNETTALATTSRYLRHTDGWFLLETMCIGGRQCLAAFWGRA